MAWSRSSDVFKFSQIGDNISETVEDGHGYNGSKREKDKKKKETLTKS